MIGIRGLLALVGCALATTAATTADTSIPQRSAPDALVFDGVTVVDVQEGKLLRDQRVVVVGNRIRALGDTRSVTVPKGARVIDARGKFLMPGLWEMHTHPRRLARYFYPLFIAYGVTGIRDAASEVPLDTLLMWRREIWAGTRVGPPRQILSGQSINERNPCSRIKFLQTCVSSADDARHLVDSLKAAGADMIKPYDLSRAMYLTIAAESRRVGLPFGGHIHAPKLTAMEASDSGAGIIDHPNTSGGLDQICWGPAASVDQCQALAEHFRRNGTWWTATLMRFEVEHMSLAGPRSRSVYARFRERVRDFWADSTSKAYASISPGGTGARSEPAAAAVAAIRPASPADSVGYMHVVRRVDLPILAATDAGAPVMMRMPPGLSLHAELAMYVAEGMTPAEALRTATLNPAKFLHATDSLGTVTQGKLADLVLLDADPLADINNTMAIRAVVANGRYYDRAALDRLVTDVKTEVLRAPSQP